MGSLGLYIYCQSYIGVRPKLSTFSPESPGSSSTWERLTFGPRDKVTPYSPLRRNRVLSTDCTEFITKQSLMYVQRNGNVPNILSQPLRLWWGTLSKVSQTPVYVYSRRSDWTLDPTLSRLGLHLLITLPRPFRFRKVLVVVPDPLSIPSLGRTNPLSYSVFYRTPNSFVRLQGLG